MSQDTTITFYNKDFKDIYDHYASLVYRLMNDLDLTIYIGNTLPPELQDAFTKISVELLVLHEKIVPCVQLMIDEEFDKTTTEGTLFRSNNFCSRVMTHYAKVCCRPFLRLTLKNVINEINMFPQLLEVDNQKDPSLTPERILQNLELLQAYTTKFIRSIETNFNNLPIQIYEICKQLFKRSKEKFPESKLLPFTMVGGFLFLRVICPALAAPEASGIEMNCPIHPNCRRNLMLITKILQNIANNITSTKEPYFEPTMPFTIQMSSKLNADIESLCIKSFPIQNSGISIKSFEDTDTNNLFELHWLLLRAKELQKEPTGGRKEMSKTLPAVPKNLFLKGRARATFVSFDKKPTEECASSTSPQSSSPRDNDKPTRRAAGWLAASPRHDDSQNSSPRIQERKTPNSSQSVSPQNNDLSSPTIPIDNQMESSDESTPKNVIISSFVRTQSDSPNSGSLGSQNSLSKSTGSFRSCSSPEVNIHVSCTFPLAETHSPINQSTTPTRGVWTRTSANKRTISPRMNALDNKTRVKEEKKRLTPLELYWLLNEFSDLLGPSPLIVEKKMGKRLNVEVVEDELGGMCEKVVEYLKSGKSAYIERAQDGTPVVYIIVNTLVQLLEKDDKIHNYFLKKWGDISQSFIKEINGKYSILFDMTGVNYSLKDKFWDCFEQKNDVFNQKQRKSVKQVILFHLNKKSKKFVTSAKALFDSKALKKLVIADTCVELEELLGINNVSLPEESVALDRREFRVIKINNKGKSQERILRLTLASICNIDPVTGLLKNTINIEKIEKIEITLISLMMDIRFRHKGKLESRLYQFKSSALIEKVLYEMYAIFLIRKGKNSTHFSFSVKKNGTDVVKPLSFAKSILKKEYRMEITLKSIMIVDMIGIKDIEVSSLMEVKKDIEGKVYIAWKDTGSDCEYLCFDPFDNSDDFVDMVKYLMSLKKRKEKKKV